LLFAYPKSAQFGRVVPKSKIYDHADAKTVLKDRFVAEVDQITWAYKLAPETLKLDAAKYVTEIQVFVIKLRSVQLSEDVLRAIDRAIPFPIIFELVHQARRRTVAAFKRPSDADKSKWVISDYFWSDWAAEDAGRASLPVSLNLAALYDKLITALMPVSAQPDEGIQSRVDRVEAVRAKEHEVAKIQAKLAKEKQFNRKVEINKALRIATQELTRLKAADSHDE
jgi:hypothetical protein